MVIFPNAKINLGLSVIRKRNDGFHDIESIFYPIGLCDALEYLPADDRPGDNPVSYSGPFPVEGRDICEKMIEMLRESFSFPPLRLHIYKKIPSGAGLGGGSSDAAHLLISMNDHFSFSMNTVQLEERASRTGSDCTFFIRNKPCLVTGKGEILQEISLSLKGFYFMLVYPGFRVSTAEAYKEIVPAQLSPGLQKRILEPAEKWKDLIVNAFEFQVFRKYPLLAEVKKELYDMGAVYASMTGSGSAVFGLFRSEIKIPSQFSHFFTFTEWLQ